MKTNRPTFKSRRDLIMELAPGQSIYIDGVTPQMVGYAIREARAYTGYIYRARTHKKGIVIWIVGKDLDRPGTPSYTSAKQNAVG